MITGITFVPCYAKSAIQYLVTVNKAAHIRTLKAHLLDLIGDDSCDIILAEVFDNHISRILVQYSVYVFHIRKIRFFYMIKMDLFIVLVCLQENSTMLRYVNDISRTIYAFEMLPTPNVDKDLLSSISAHASSANEVDVSTVCNNQTVCNNDERNNASTILNNLVSQYRTVYYTTLLLP